MKQIIPFLMMVIVGSLWTSANGQTTDANQQMIKVYVKQDPSTYVKEKSDQPLELEYAVQLSASSRPILDKSSLSSWEELGPLYIHEENGLFKVRIGPFHTQDQAKEVLLHAKQRGKKDAFIVVQKGLETYTKPEGFQQQEAMVVLPASGNTSDLPPAPPVASPEKPVPPSKVINVVPSEESMDEMVEYKVRLASYLKPGGFSTKDVDQYGPLESYRKGEWTILMIGGFKTEQDAIKVRDQVVAKGFKDAGVVVVRDGILELED